MSSFSNHALIGLTLATLASPNLFGWDGEKSLQIRLVRSSSGHVVSVTGFSASQLAELRAANAQEKLSEWLAMAVVQGGEASDTALFGEYQLSGGTLRFLPRFPLSPGLRYQVRVQQPAGKEPRVSAVEVFAIPDLPPVPATEVAHVYPSATRLPENLLKFYLHFSAPMGRGQVYRCVHLLDEDNKEVEAAFLELGEELWDPAGTRITLLFDPGRVKRELKPNRDVGLALQSGKRYTLLVDRKWRDAQGNPLAREFRKAFLVVDADYGQPDPQAWMLDVPQAGTKDSFGLTFPEPLDHAMLQRVLVLEDPHGNELAGSIRIGNEERRWEFQPAEPWVGGDYALRIDEDLEDVAGNSVGRPFEVDQFQRVERKVAKSQTRRRFRVE